MIRQAEETDIRALVDIGALFWEATQFFKEGSQYSHERATQTALAAYERGIALVSENDGSVDGMILFIVCPSPFSDELVAAEIVFFVSPEARGKGAGRELLEAGVLEAREFGCTRASVGNMFSVSPEVSEKLFNEAGFHLAENTYTIKL
jgi:GNAT superfamily N-acetyltransferase